MSVGIDIGTTTTQIVFSRLTVSNENSQFTVPKFTIAHKEILYRSEVHFTPLLSETEIDAAGIRSIVDREYAASGFAKEDIQTGAVIITGETARKENAREVLDALSGYAGDFVVATAGPALESVLAGKGAGSEEYSREHRCPVLNLDIGGGTTNLALFDRGVLRDTGCLNVGGRLMKFDPDGTLRYLSPVLRPFFNFSIGARLRPEELKPVTDLLVTVLEEAVGLGETSDLLPRFITDKTVTLDTTPLLSFSGGVADLMDDKVRQPFLYGDLGVLLGQAIYHSRLFAGQVLQARETIRATVIGAGSHTTELSGSTIYYENIDFPLKNLPVAVMRPEEEILEPGELARCIKDRMTLYSANDVPEPMVLGLHGGRSLRFSELCKLADGIAMGLSPAAEAGLPLVVAVEADMGKVLGQALNTLLPQAPLVCLDGVHLPEGAYLDIGAPVAGGQVLPVVVKTLAIQ